MCRVRPPHSEFREAPSIVEWKIRSVVNLRVLFFCFLLLQLPVYAVLMWLTFSTRPILFYGAELMLALDIAACLFFYRKVLVPVETLANGMDLLKGQDWNVALRPLGLPEVARSCRSSTK